MRTERALVVDCALNTEEIIDRQLPDYTADEIAEQQASAMIALKNAVIRAIQQQLDAVAQSRGYDNILSACSYVGSTNQIFSDEATSCIAYRDAAWTVAYEILQAVESGTRAVPTMADVLAEMPTAPW